MRKLDDSLIGQFYHGMQAGLSLKTDVGVDPSLIDLFNWQLNSCSLDQKFVARASRVAKAPIEVREMRGRGSSQNSKLVSIDELDQHELVIGYGAGIDSTIAFFWALNELHYKDVALVQVNYGAPYQSKENQAARSLRDIFIAAGGTIYLVTIKDAPIITEDQMGLGYIIPMRNPLIASIISAFASESWIVANYRKIDDGPNAASDKNRRFYLEMSRILSQHYEEPTKVWSPFLHMSKAATIDWFIDNYQTDLVYEVISKTTTCYHPKHHRCGECFACMKLMMSLETSKWNDMFGWELLGFKVNPAETEHFVDYLNREEGKGRPIPEKWKHLIASRFSKE
jgi:7-cyano-7-deazaguanine synthase in queuosine biosynthesis